MALSKGPIPLSRAQKIPRGSHKLERSRCIAAIDFGTSSLSVAYITPYDEQIRLVQLHSTYERVPNTILIVKDQGKQEKGKKQEEQRCNVIGIGYKAQSLYSSITNDVEKFIYFERIKNLLQRDQVCLY